MSGVGAAADAVIGKDIVPVGLPYRLCAAFRKKTSPDQNIVAIGTKGMAGTNAMERKVAEEAIQISIVQRPVTKDHRNVRIKAIP